MLCPVDQAHTIAQPIYLQDRQLELEQCPVCRGIWVNHDSAEHLTEANVEAIDTGTPPFSRYSTLRCPVDGILLAPLPELTGGTAQELRGCPSCLGVWFAAGQLREFVANKRGQAMAELAATPAPLRNFVGASLISFVLASGLALAGFRFAARISAEGTTPTPLVSDLKLGLWFLVFAELLIWPLIFARDIRLLRASSRVHLISYFWTAVVIVTTLITFTLTRL